MEKFSRFLKILVAAILVGCLVFFGIRQYLINEDIKKSNENAALDAIVGQVEAERNPVTYQDADDNIKVLVTDYIEKIYMKNVPFEKITNIRDLSEDYIINVVYKNLPEKNGVYTYPELNRIVTELFGKDAHNMFPNKSSKLFSKTTEGFSILEEDVDELLSYNYLIDSVKLGSDGLYYATILEYIRKDEPLTEELSIEDDGKKIQIYNLDSKLIEEFKLEILPFEENELTMKVLNSEGKEIENISEEVSKKKDLLKKRVIILEYDEALNLVYMKSNALEG